jgi:hypothetical protein
MTDSFIYYVFLLFLLLFPSDIDAFACIATNITRFKLQKFNFDAFEKNIISQDTESQNYDIMCKVYMSKTHDDLVIWFGTDPSLYSNVDDGGIYYRTTVSLNKIRFKFLISQKK